MHFYVPSLVPQARDRKAQRAAKADALASTATRRARACGANPSGKPGKGPATSLQVADGINTVVRPAPSCRAFPRLSRARKSA